MLTSGERPSRKENILNWTTEDKLDLMWDRFVNEGAWFAKQKAIVDGNQIKIVYFPMRSGECTHEPKHRAKDCPDIHKLEFTKEYLLEHLQGKHTFAPYQVSRHDTVKWLCLDLDYGEETGKLAIQLSKQIYDMFKGNYSLIEDSGSKGHHVWLFFDEPIPAGYAISLGHALSQRVTLPPGGSIEVYPKQSSRKLLGNTVKLPLGVHQKTQRRCMFQKSSGGQLVNYENQWEALKNVKLLSSELIKTRFQEYSSDRPRDEIDPEPAPACLIEIMEIGVRPGFKDEPTFKLACYLRAKGISESMALASLREWNRLNQDPVDDDQIEIKVESAYGSDYGYLPCSSPLFDHVCVSTCPYFEYKERIRWRNPSKSPKGVISRE